jgi:hypothetical protein
MQGRINRILDAKLRFKCSVQNSLVRLRTPTPSTHRSRYGLPVGYRPASACRFALFCPTGTPFAADLDAFGLAHPYLSGPNAPRPSRLGTGLTQSASKTGRVSYIRRVQMSRAIQA